MITLRPGILSNGMLVYLDKNSFVPSSSIMLKGRIACANQRNTSLAKPVICDNCIRIKLEN